MLSSGLRMPVGPRSPSGTWGPRTKTLSDASGASRFTRGSSSSQWVSTPPITPGMPRRPVTAIFMPFASERVAVDDDAKGAQQDHRVEPQRPVAHIFEVGGERSEEHTSELQSLMRISYAVFCLKKKIKNIY